MMAGAVDAMAGGFAIREQSAESQGASFAGNAAGTGISSMYWNPAAAANISGPGINTSSNYSVIIPRATINVDSISGPAAGPTAPFFAAAPNSTDIGVLALVPASYGSYQLSPNFFVGLGMNSGFGLKTEPTTQNYDGAILGRTSSLFTLNANPNVAYKIAPGITIGGGAQISYAKGVFKFATGVPQQPSTVFEGSDYGFGGTAGIMLEPAAGTRIGLGWRSAVDYKLEGDFSRPAVPALGVTAQRYKGTADVKLPDTVTLSINQAVAPNMRLLGTLEWANWSRFNELRVKSQNGAVADVVIPADWVDSWFASVGAEFDYSKQLTLRGGVGYEWSPIDDGNNRIWLSLGATYKVSQVTSIDLAYTHLIIEDSTFDRSNTTGSLNLKGTIEASTDILSLGLKTKF
jgi:long-chain fatty acid transport protein